MVSSIIITMSSQQSWLSSLSSITLLSLHVEHGVQLVGEV